MQSVCTLGSSATHGRTSKNGIWATLNFPTLYKEDGNDLLKRIIIGNESWIHFYKPERKSVIMIWKKRGRTARKFKNKWPAGQVMLTTSEIATGDWTQL